MCALRWGKTLGAYNKYKRLFQEPFPRVYQTSSPLAQASYIRDALKFAAEHHLPGGQYHKKVMVSPEEEGVVIRLKNDQGSAIASYPVETVFTLLQKNEALALGYEFVATNTPEELNGVLEAFGFKVKLIENHYIIEPL